jgi:prepilin-type N-terminal cleavage/methylation domain-containing protein
VRHPFRYQRGFTLIELSVVTAMLAVLIGLLLPSGWLQRSDGRRVGPPVCLHTIDLPTFGFPGNKNGGEVMGSGDF